MLVERTERKIVLNGEPRTVSSATVAELLTELNVAGKRVAVELNRQVIARDNYPTMVISESDVVEVVQFVGGG